MITESYWTLKEALDLIRALQVDVGVFGYHLCLGGGVLNRGHSNKDLDLYFLPLDRADLPPQSDKLMTWLEVLWGEGVDLSQRVFEDVLDRDSEGRRRVGSIEVTKYPSTPTSPYLFKRTFMWSGLRIDVFVIDLRKSEEGEVNTLNHILNEANNDRPAIDQGPAGPDLGAPVGRVRGDRARAPR